MHPSKALFIIGVAGSVNQFGRSAKTIERLSFLDLRQTNSEQDLESLTFSGKLFPV
jgi:hypothetical protein